MLKGAVEFTVSGLRAYRVSGLYSEIQMLVRSILRPFQKVLDVVSELNITNSQDGKAPKPGKLCTSRVYDPTFKNFSLLDQSKHMQGERPQQWLVPKAGSFEGKLRALEV